MRSPLYLDICILIYLYIYILVYLYIYISLCVHSLPLFLCGVCAVISSSTVEWMRVQWVIYEVSLWVTHTRVCIAFSANVWIRVSVCADTHREKKNVRECFLCVLFLFYFCFCFCFISCRRNSKSVLICLIILCK